MSTGAYEGIELATPGLIDGLNKEIETFIVQEDDTFDFGDPVFAEEGGGNLAELGDDSNSALVFAGVAIISQRSFVESQSEYPEFDSVNVLSKGRVWVKVVEGLSGITNKPAYVIVDSADGDYGEFTDVDSNYGTGGWFRSEPITVGSDTLAIIEVQGLNKEAADT